MTKTETATPGHQKAPKVRFYRNIVATFVALNIILLVFVVYLSFVKATVTVKPKNMVVTTQYIADIAVKPERSTEIPGAIASKVFEKSKQFQITGATEVPGRATGKVTLINNTGSSQPLVKTTRVLTKENIQFRITEAVLIPAHGQTEVSVLADKEGKEGDLEPTTFTIPGLPASLQSQIYAESKLAFTGGVSTIATVEQADLDKANQELSDEISKEAEASLAEGNEAYTGRTFVYDLIEKKSDTKPGTHAGAFTISAKIKVTGVFYDQTSLLNLTKVKLFAATPRDLTLREVQSSNIVASLDKYDLKTGVANLKVSASGVAHIKEGGTVLNKDRLAGLSVKEATSLLMGNEEIEDVKIVIRPFWIKTLPKLKDHIEIKIDER
ncbi:MAG: baseplate J/gp47 family protein [bacterium]